MQLTVNETPVLPGDDKILARRNLGRELRPTRADMLRLYREDFVKPSLEAVCKGNCIYCDSDGGVG
jgi:hypothetical protein